MDVVDGVGRLEQTRVEVEHGVATITLNRPERFNAYTVRMGMELFAALAALDADEAVRVIVVTGAGKHFCAGADLEPAGDTFAGDDTWKPAARFEADAAPWKLRTPVVAAINGAAVGVGATLPLSWDLRVASERAKIGFVFTRRGIVPEANSTWLLPRLVGLSHAQDLLLTGRWVPAREALTLGLVSRVYPAENFAESVAALARDIAENTAPTSVALTKRLVWAQLGELDPVRAKTREDEVFALIGKTPDAREGVEAFLEKRTPRWTGKKSAADSLLARPRESSEESH